MDDQSQNDNPTGIHASLQGTRAFLVFHGIKFRVLESGTAGNKKSLEFARHEDFNAYILGNLADQVRFEAEHQIRYVFGANEPLGTSTSTPADIIAVWNSFAFADPKRNPNEKGNIPIVGHASMVEDAEAPGGTWNQADWYNSFYVDTTSSFSGGTDIADLTVTEDDAADTTASGFIRIEKVSRGDVFFGDAEDAGATVSGTGNLRKAVYQGNYGQLVIDHDGDWVYTLDNSRDTTQGLTAGQSEQDRFTITVVDLGHDDIKGNEDDRTASITLTVTVEGVDPDDITSQSVPVIHLLGIKPLLQPRTSYHQQNRPIKQE